MDKYVNYDRTYFVIFTILSFNNPFASVMNASENYLNINRESWNKRTEVHIGSDFYDMESFLAGRSSLNAIELDLMGDVKGKKILHLQCHFGQDSISLARMGAEVVGVDLANKAIDHAHELAEKLNANARFICCDIYDLPDHLDEAFDIVFSSYGTIGWLPDLDKWAKIIHRSLKPGGRFIFVEFHPVVWMFDNDFKSIAYNYFKTDAIVESYSGTYADRNAAVTIKDVSWNHSLAEVFSGLLNAGLQLKCFEEFDYSPYPCFNAVTEYEPGKYRIGHLGNNIPMVYALVAEK